MHNLAVGDATSPGLVEAREKVRTIEALGDVARSAQARGLKVALCHGVFDVVHLGHIRHIQDRKSVV